MKKRLLSLLLALLVLCSLMPAAFADGETAEEPLLIAPAPSTAPSPFALSVGVSEHLSIDGYAYEFNDYMTGELVSVAVPLFRVVVPEGTTEFTLTFTEERIAYAYADMGLTYIASCAADAVAGYANNGQTGELTATVRAGEDGKLPPYVQVQTPYTEDWSSTTLYGIRIETGDGLGYTEYPFTPSVGEVTDVQEDGYAYEFNDYMTGELVSVSVPLYTVTVPAGTTELELAFAEEQIAYAYADKGLTYIASCAADAVAGYANNGQTGEKTAAVRPKEDGVLPPYVQVQTPYTEDWSSTTLYGVTFVFGSATPFTDVAGHWAEAAITYAYEKGLVKGMTLTTFEPETLFTRAMLVEILYRQDGRPSVELEDMPFTDVKETDWFNQSAQWAKQNGLVDAEGLVPYGGREPITREAFAEILFRYASMKGQVVGAVYQPGYEEPNYGDGVEVPAPWYFPYADKDQIGADCMTALRWTNENGIIIGRGSDELAPKAFTTRAEAVTILMRYLEKIAEKTPEM